MFQHVGPHLNSQHAVNQLKDIKFALKGKKHQGLYLCRYNYAKPPSLSSHILMPLFISPKVYTWHQQGTKRLCSRAGNGSCVFRAGACCDSAAFPWAAPVLRCFSPLLCRKSVTSLGRLFTSWQVILAADLPLAQGFLSPSHPPLPSVPCVSEGSLRATVIMVCKKSPRVLPGRCFQRHRRAYAYSSHGNEESLGQPKPSPLSQPASFLVQKGALLLP